MGYLNEFPHVESNKLNLDWLLEQYRTFNDRIAEIQAHFDEVAEEMRQENAQYKADMLAAFNSFKDDVNEQVASISNAIEQVSDNVTEFVGEHMDEWQLDAMTGENNDIIIGEYDPEQPITEGGNLNEIIINNTKFNIREFNLPIDRFVSLTFTDADLEALSGAKQLADITTSFDLYAYFQKAETEYGLDGNNCIDYIFPCITYPANWGSTEMLTIAQYQLLLSGVRVQKASNSYKLQISYGVGNYTTHLSGQINIKVLPILPYLG
jgi:hypothetical protein